MHTPQYIEENRPCPNSGIAFIEEKHTYKPLPTLESRVGIHKDAPTNLHVRCFLFEVKVDVPLYVTETIYVLAESEEGAISQVCCQYKDWLQKRIEENHCIAKQIPFMVRGWSKHIF